MATFRPHPPVVNPWGNTPQPDAATPAAPSQETLPTPPTHPETRRYNGPLYTEMQKQHIDYVARKINNSINRYQSNRFIPNDLAKEIILGKSRNPPQIRSLIQVKSSILLIALRPQAPTSVTIQIIVTK